MSNFMSTMRRLGLTARPPLSNVTALPISASRRDSAAARRAVVAQRDQPRVLLGALGDRGERAHPQSAELLAAEHVTVSAGRVAASSAA